MSLSKHFWSSKVKRMDRPECGQESSQPPECEEGISQPPESKWSANPYGERVGLFKLEKDTPNHAYVLDIVAVHGLNGRWDKTWEHDNGKLWLRDFLPSQLRDANINARIMSFGYNSTTAFSKAVTNIDTEAEALLDRLEGNREQEDEKRRPIIFISHSLGGLIAMIIAWENSDTYGDLLKSVRGSVFFGVPHCGADLAYWANLPAKLLKYGLFEYGVNNAYLDALKTNSPTWRDISKQFVKRAAPLKIRTFYETEKFFNLLIVDEDSSRLHLPNERAVGVASSHHMNMCQFDQPDSQRYEPVWKAVRKLAQEVIVDSDPSYGKSVLSSFLVEELRSRESQATLSGEVCFFFLKDDNDQQKSAVSALCARLHQLFDADHFLVRHAMSAFRSKAGKFTEEFGTLWNILTTVSADSSCENIICIIDGLDECEVLTRDLLLESLVDFYSQAETRKPKQPFLKIIVTSRPVISIEDRFHDLSIIRLKTEDETDATTGDIELVLKDRVKAIGKRRSLSGEAQHALVDRLISNANRTFLWVSLVLADIERSPRMSKGALDDLVDKIPETLDLVYERFLSQSCSPLHAKKLLHIVLGAARPLSLDEMNVAFVIKSGDQSYEDLDLEPSISDTVKSLCGLFLIEVDSKIYFVHQTARQFLIDSSNTGVPSLGAWKHSLRAADSHRVLAEISILYLLFTVFEDTPLYISPQIRDPRLFRPYLCDKIREYMKGHDFLDYAAKHWPTHFREGNILEDTEIANKMIKVCDTSTKRFLTWFQLYWTTIDLYHRAPDNVTDLMVYSFFGHESVLPSRQLTGAELESRDDTFGRTPLSWAAERGHEGMVQLLLAAGADPECKARFDETPLLTTAFRGHEGVARLLLAAGAEPGHKDVYGQTPLVAAAGRGHEGVVRLLLADSRLEPDSKNKSLSCAAAEALTGVVRLLLADSRVEPNCKNDNGPTPLSRAASLGHEGVMRLLLADSRVEPDSVDSWGRAPLWYAAGNGRDGVVRLLLATSRVDPDFMDAHGRTPLSWAVKNGHQHTVRTLTAWSSATNSQPVKRRRLERS
ncbi:MAG: hypothetical protein M1837_007512 [Sclerophora amabilis]|nr:MAG: hypothetical protein M1837_007512 [Sclerophora amabilis]